MKPTGEGGFRYRRRVQYYETDLAGIVHFSWLFRYMEEAEHALWRAAGLSIDRAGAETGWPRVSATFDFRRPLHFEDEVEVCVSIAETTRRTVRYAFAVTRGEAAIGTGEMTVACATKRDGRLQATDLPRDVIERLRAAATAPDATASGGRRDRARAPRRRPRSAPA